MDIADFLVRSSVGYLYWKDKEGRYLGCNDEFARFLKLNSPQEIVGKVDADFVPDFLLKDILKIDQEIISTGNEKIVEETLLGPEGAPVFLLSKKSPFKDNSNRIIGVVGTAINITQYTESQNTVFFHSTGNLFWKDREGKYLGCNEACAKFLNLDSPTEVVGKTDAEFIPEEYRDKILELDRYVIETGEEQVVEEVSADHNGNLAFYISKKTPLKDRHGNIIGLTGTSLDITKFKQAEIAKNEFFRNMSHDIMTPFTGILGISRMLYEEETDDEKKTNLQYLVQSADRLLQLLKQMLTLSEMGGTKVEIKEFDIYETVSQIVEMSWASAYFKKLKLSFDCAKRKVKSDPLYISRILINLVSNAIKFTDEGFVHIEVICDNFLTISVKDSGAGIPSDKLTAIFNKFYKLKESGRNSHFTGAGIGLYIAKQWAHELGGSITVSSELNVGSVFTFSQPLKSH
jgi:two-component system aerobic respiration control sensor histidine kinase ArcB